MTTNINPFKFYFGYVIILIILILSLALAHKSKAQQTWLRVEQGSGTPTFNPNSPAPKQGYIYNDSIINKWYLWTSGTSWKPSNLFKGIDGVTPIFQTGTTTVVTPDTPAKLQLRVVSPNTYAVDAWIPQGQPGKDGTGTGMMAGTLTPDQYGARHSGELITSNDLAYYSSVGATTSDTYDWGAWQMCVSVCDGKIIFAYGKYFWNRSIVKGDLTKCKIIGGNAIVVSTNNDSFTMLTTSMPADFNAAEARCGAGANFVIEDFRFEGTLNQIAFKPYATSNNRLTNVTTAGFGTGILLNFCMLGIYDNITCLNGKNGLLLSWGGYPNDTPISSRFPTCNGCKIRNYHAVNITNIAIANYGAYNVEMNIAGIEGNGGTINRPVDIDDMGNTGCKNFYITGGDFEGISIAANDTNAYLHVHTVVGGMKVYIADVNMHTAGNFIWAYGQNAPTMIVERVNWILSKPCLVNNGFTWQFNYCDAFPFASAIAGQFKSSGTLVTACNPDANGEPKYNAQGCGANHFNYSTQGR